MSEDDKEEYEMFLKHYKEKHYKIGINEEKRLEKIFIDEANSNFFIENSGVNAIILRLYGEW